MLYGLIKPHPSVSLVGMCKNAGKTTVLNRLIADCARGGERIALTSVGRDGERSDLVTGTKKPEIYIFEGTLIATAEGALELGDVSYEVMDTTAMPTPMGEVVIVRAHSDGLVQLAGPSMTAQLIPLRERLFELGAERVFIDGALSRKSLAMPAVSSAAILCTGASYSRDMERTASDTAYSARLMSLEQAKEKRLFSVKSAEKFVLIDERGEQGFGEAALAADAVRKSESKTSALLVRGGITDQTVNALLSAGRALEGVELAAEDASRILVAQRNYEKLVRVGVSFGVLQPMRLIAVTVNPFSAYGDSFDSSRFIDAVRRAVGNGVPVVDVMAQKPNQSFERSEEAICSIKNS